MMYEMFYKWNDSYCNRYVCVLDVSCIDFLKTVRFHPKDCTKRSCDYFA
jgi:hypothetical protein